MSKEISVLEKLRSLSIEKGLPNKHFTVIIGSESLVFDDANYGKVWELLREAKAHDMSGAIQ